MKHLSLSWALLDCRYHHMAKLRKYGTHTLYVISYRFLLFYSERTNINGQLAKLTTISLSIYFFNIFIWSINQLS